MIMQKLSKSLTCVHFVVIEKYISILFRLNLSFDSFHFHALHVVIFVMEDISQTNKKCVLTKC